jgi:uncharacterized protein (DUF58 family)
VPVHAGDSSLTARSENPGASRNIRVTYTYRVTPTRRGQVSFGASDVRVHSRYELCQMLEKLGEGESRRAYPDFAQVARYPWLAGDRRLGIELVNCYQAAKRAGLI